MYDVQVLNWDEKLIERSIRYVDGRYQVAKPRRTEEIAKLYQLFNTAVPEEPRDWRSLFKHRQLVCRETEHSKDTSSSGEVI